MSAINGSNSLQHYVEQLEEIASDQRPLARTKRNLLAEAAAAGLHVHALKDVVRLRTQSSQKTEERRIRQEKFDEYRNGRRPVAGFSTYPSGVGVAARS